MFTLRDKFLLVIFSALILQQSSICRACKKPLDINSGKCILDENTTIKSFDINGTYDDLWEMSVYSGLEIITGNPVRNCFVLF